jgi:hypothetical protein
MSPYIRRSTSFAVIFQSIMVLVLLGLNIKPIFGQGANDVTSQVERIGNPFEARYPDGDLVYARNVWSMQPYDDRLYFGHGNANNDGPAPNAGPVEIWSYNGEDFTAEYTVNDQQVDHFNILEGDLYVAGFDTMSAEQIGNYYHLVDGTWQEHKTIPQAAHVYDLALYQERLFAATGAANPNGPQGHAIQVSDDNGKTWVGLNLIAAQSDDGDLYEQVAWEFVPVGDDLFVSAQPLILLVEGDDGTVQRQTFGQMLHHYQDGEFVPLEIDGFPTRTFDVSKERSLRMARVVPFGDGTVYVGATVQGTGHQWTPFGLFYIQKTDDSYSIDALPQLESIAYVWDTLVEDGALYIVGSTCTPIDGFGAPCTVTVAATCDLQAWREVLQFQSETFARSFALYRGDFYFGLGTDTTTLSAQTGDILRVKQAAFTTGC